MKTIDDYIANASESTQPILVHLRKLIHIASPEIKENIKWNAPSFEHNEKIVCNIMAFKRHVNFMFHQGKQLENAHGVLVDIGAKSNMKGIKQIEKLSDLPKEAILVKLIKEAVEIAKSQ